jgi:hypothetical protein
MKFIHLNHSIERHWVERYHNNKASLHCAVEESWQDILLRPLLCGDKYKHTFRRRTGVNVSDRIELEALIKGSVGLKGIAELASSIKSSSSQEISLQEMQEAEEEYTFEAPKCGRYTVALYQLKRTHQFFYEDHRFLHKEVWSKTVTEWTNQIYNASTRIEYDPSCGCKEQSPTEHPDGFVILDLGKIIWLVEYRNKDYGFYIPRLGFSVQGNIDHLKYGQTVIPVDRNLIPPYLLFLADESEPMLSAKIRLEPDKEDSMKPGQVVKTTKNPKDLLKDISLDPLLREEKFKSHQRPPRKDEPPEK